jgi:hypothetical protein
MNWDYRITAENIFEASDTNGTTYFRILFSNNRLFCSQKIFGLLPYLQRRITQKLISKR